MECCVCGRTAVVSFGFDEATARLYCAGLKTYVASGGQPIILTFCADHAGQAVVTWPGLVARPVQAVPRFWREGRLAIAALKARLEDPKARFIAYLLWRRERERRHPTRLWAGLRDAQAAAWRAAGRAAPRKSLAPARDRAILTRP